MRITFAAALVLAAFVSAGAPAGAAATPAPVGPVRVDAADIAPVIDGADDPQASGFVNITFTNLRDTAATQILFALESPDEQVKWTITDSGTFGKGIKVTHHFTMLSDDRRLHVVVLKATFADGSTWQAGDPY
jgi:hypothetical protein